MSWIKPALFIAAPFPGAFASNFITRKNIPTWFDSPSLVKPVWRPPNWAFAPVWTTLYTSMGYASYLIWRDGGGFEGEAQTALTLYGTQLAFNWAWSHIFFGYHRLGLAFADLLAVWGGAAACIYTFYPINRTASYLLMPYLAWLTLAGALNYNIWQRNKTPKAIEDKKEE